MFITLLIIVAFIAILLNLLFGRGSGPKKQNREFPTSKNNNEKINNSKNSIFNLFNYLVGKGSSLYCY